MIELRINDYLTIKHQKGDLFHYPSSRLCLSDGRNVAVKIISSDSWLDVIWSVVMTAIGRWTTLDIGSMAQLSPEQKVYISTNSLKKRVNKTLSKAEQKSGIKLGGSVFHSPYASFVRTHVTRELQQSVIQWLTSIEHGTELATISIGRTSVYYTQNGLFLRGKFIGTGTYKQVYRGYFAPKASPESAQLVALSLIDPSEYEAGAEQRIIREVGSKHLVEDRLIPPPPFAT